MLLIAAMVLAAGPTVGGPTPTVESAVLSADQQWAAILACPKVITRSGARAAATGVAVGVRGGYAYVLTAQHAVPGVEEREIQFFTKESYPVPAVKIRGVEVVTRWDDPDLALLKVKLGPDTCGVLRLAGVGQRPKNFPVEVLSIGCARGEPPTARVGRIVAKKPARRPGGGLAFFWELADAPVPGRSGGPLLDNEGRVIGVCAAGRNGRGYYTHLDEILAALVNDSNDWLWQRTPDGVLK
ncbi:MAG: S1 family peptidase [Fimbriiglobus sp.]